MIVRFDRLRREEFEVDPAGYERLRGQIALWKEGMLDRGNRLGRRYERDRGIDDDLDMGF